MKTILYSLSLIISVVACRSGEVQVRSPHWNKDTCAYCRMAVSSPQYAAQLVGRGGRVRHYDDLGCLIKDQHQHSALSGLTAYVTAPQERERWIPAASVRFAEGLPTPMDFGFGPQIDGPLSYAEVVSRVTERRLPRGAP